MKIENTLNEFEVIYYYCEWIDYANNWNKNTFFEYEVVQHVSKRHYDWIAFNKIEREKPLN